MTYPIEVRRTAKSQDGWEGEAPAEPNPERHFPRFPARREPRPPEKSYFAVLLVRHCRRLHLLALRAIIWYFCIAKDYAACRMPTLRITGPVFRGSRFEAVGSLRGRRLLCFSIFRFCT